MLAYLTLTALVLTSGIKSNTAVAQLPDVRTRQMPIRFADIELPDAPHEHAEAKIIVGGYLPSTCYSDLRTQVENPDPHTHVVKAYATKRVSGFCSQPLSPFEESVSLGKLPAGEHRLVVQAVGESFAVRQFTVSR